MRAWTQAGLQPDYSGLLRSLSNRFSLFPSAPRSLALIQANSNLGAILRFVQQIPPEAYRTPNCAPHGKTGVALTWLPPSGGSCWGVEAGMP